MGHCVQCAKPIRGILNIDDLLCSEECESTWTSGQVLNGFLVSDGWPPTTVVSHGNGADQRRVARTWLWN